MSSNFKKRHYNLPMNPFWDPNIEPVSKRTIRRWQSRFSSCEPKTADFGTLDANISTTSSLEHGKSLIESNNTQLLDNETIHKFSFINNYEKHEHSSTKSDNIDIKTFEDNNNCPVTCDEFVYNDYIQDENSLSDESFFTSSEDEDDRSNIVEHSETFEKLKFCTDKVQGSRMMFPAANFTVADVLLMITAFSTSKNFTQRDEDDLVEFVKQLAGPDFSEWTASHYMRSKIYDPPPATTTIHFFCDSCTKILTKRTLKSSAKPKSVECENCKKKIITSNQSENSFIINDISYQLKMLLSDAVLQSKLFEYLEYIQKDEKNDVIYDVSGSQLHNILQNNWPCILTLNMNTDGAPAFKSSKVSFWPQQLILNELPPEFRFQNIILSGIFLTNREPKAELMNLYNLELCKQIALLTENGINIRHHSNNEVINLKFTLCCSCVDAPARAVCQNRLQYNGYYGCSWCYARGKWDGDAMRYPLTEDDPNLRTHEQMLLDIAELNDINRTSKKSSKKSHMGVKGSTPFIEELHLFDSIWGFPLDYMHGVLLGVTRQMWTLWRNSESKYSLSRKDCEKINVRLSRIKPPQEIHRMPRPITDCVKWKASEWKWWLLFWSLVCLDGILNEEYYRSYALFVRSIFTLLERKITKNCIEKVEYDLLQFVGECQIFFGEKAMTFNLHSLLHLGHSVRCSGPLWATSTFPFENGIFYHKQNINGPRGVGQQIAKKWVKKIMFLTLLDVSTESLICKNYCKQLFNHRRLTTDVENENDSHIALVGKITNSPKLESHIIKYFNGYSTGIKMFNRCIYKSTKFCSSKYSRAEKTNDTFALLHSGKIIQIKCFAVINEKYYVYGSYVNIIPTELRRNLCLSYMFTINDDEKTFAIVDIKDIKEKVIFLQSEKKKFICLFPNIVDVQ